MAKSNKKKNAEAAAAKAAGAPSAESAAPAAKEIKGQAQNLVQVQYKGDNHHHLHGVHALRPGVNHLPKAVWEEAKKQPHNAMLVTKGLAIESAPEAEESSEEESEEGSESSESESSEEGSGDAEAPEASS